MSELKILKYPEDVTMLRTISKPVAMDESKEAYKLGEEMLKLLNGTNELGLSAVQVGRPIKMFVIKIDDNERIFINPKIELQTREKIWSIESCLSFDVKNDLYRIKRTEGLKLSFREPSGKIRLEQFFGLEAIIIQHEMDHLKGRIMLDVGEKQDIAKT